MFDIRDLSEWYPLLPGKIGNTTAVETAVDAALSNILDIRITLELLPGNPGPANSYNYDAIVCRLVRVYRTYENDVEVWKADIKIDGLYIPVNGVLTNSGTGQTLVVTLPVYAGRNTLPATAANYLLLEHFAELDNIEYVIHPDCLTVYQKPPSLTFFERAGVRKEDRPGNDQATRKDRVEMQPLSLADGHNVTVELIGDILTFTGDDGVGLGVYTIPPYIDEDVSYSVSPGKGLRSINGYTDNVTLDTSRTIKLQSSGTADTVSLTISVEGSSS